MSYRHNFLVLGVFLKFLCPCNDRGHYDLPVCPFVVLYGKEFV